MAEVSSVQVYNKESVPRHCHIGMSRFPKHPFTLLGRQRVNSLY